MRRQPGSAIRSFTSAYLAGLALPALLTFAVATAAAVTISPIMVELTPQKRIASIRLLNDSTEVMTFQAETLAWRQVAGVDHHTQTHELLVAPTVVQIAPGASQIFRVTLRKPAVTDAELAYRLVLEDVTADLAQQPGTVKLRFRHNLPLFVTPRQLAVVNSQWRRCAAPANQACIQLDNQGNRHVRLSGFVVEGSDWRKEIPGGATVLAGASRQWIFELGAGQSAALRVIATSGTGDILKAVELPVPVS